MKLSLRHLLSVAALICGYAGTHASAAETITIPFSAAMQRTSGTFDACDIDLGGSIFTPDPTPAVCSIDFPLTIPAGHTIDQIWVIHGDDGFFPYRQIQAWLGTQDSAAPFDSNVLFLWTDSSTPPFGTIVTDHLMAQSYKAFPDAFMVAPGTLYHVVVRLYGSAILYGLSVRYE